MQLKARRLQDRLTRAPSHLQAEASALVGGAKLTYLPFIVKALSISLAAFPGMHMQMAPGGGELLQLGHHNIGVAMATPGGLVVPNVKAVSGLLD